MTITDTILISMCGGLVIGLTGYVCNIPPFIIFLFSLLFGLLIGSVV